MISTECNISADSYLWNNTCICNKWTSQD